MFPVLRIIFAYSICRYQTATTETSIRRLFDQHLPTGTSTSMFGIKAMSNSMFVFRARNGTDLLWISFFRLHGHCRIFISNADMFRVNTRGLGMPGMFHSLFVYADITLLNICLET